MKTLDARTKKEKKNELKNGDFQTDPNRQKDKNKMGKRENTEIHRLNCEKRANSQRQ